MQSFVKVIVQLLVLTGLVVGGYYTVENRNEILDAYYLRDYNPPARIAQLADQAGLTEEGRRLFYRSQPEINTERSQLAQNCRIKDENTIELGCYLSTNKIYLLDIQDPQLSSEMIVTALHETLHAAFDRLDDQEKRDVIALLEAETTLQGKAEVDDRLADYGDLSEDDRVNELHAIMGSEFGRLSPALEKYYARYTNNRAQVVAYSDKFDQTFDGLRAEIDRLDNRIRATRSRMEALRANGQVEAYNALVPVINRDIDTYNRKVTQYNRYAGVLLGTASTETAQ